MITLDDVTLTFPDGDSRITAVDHVSLSVPAGRVTGITGPSGSGKSSLLAVAATLIHPDSGSVRIGGIEAATLSRGEATALRRERIGIVFQQSNLLPSLTAREQLLVMGELGGSAAGRRAAIRERADELLDAVWDDVPPVLRQAAAATLVAHLDKLREEGRLPEDIRWPQWR